MHCGSTNLKLLYRVQSKIASHSRPIGMFFVTQFTISYVFAH